MVHEDPTLLDPGRADRDVLGPFYARAAAVIRRHDPEGIIFFQPATFPDTLPFASGPVVSAVGFSKDPVARYSRDVAEMPP